MNPNGNPLDDLRNYQRELQKNLQAAAAAIKRLRDEAEDKKYIQAKKNELALAGVSINCCLDTVINHAKDEYDRRAGALASLALRGNSAPTHQPASKRARSTHHVPVPTAPRVTNVITQPLPPLPPLPSLPATPPHAERASSPPLLVESEMHKNKKRYMAVFTDWAQKNPEQAKENASFFYTTVDKTTKENVIQNTTLHVTFDSFFKMRPSAKKKIEYLPQSLITYAREKGLQIRGKPVQFDK